MLITTTMTIHQTQTRVDQIVALADTGNHKQAAREEASLYTDVLEAIASGTLPCGEAAEMARIAYQTGNLDFPR